MTILLFDLQVTLTFNLPEQTFQMNECATLFWNPCINIQVIARTSSIYDHFIIWPSSVTLTSNLPAQRFQITLLILKENNCAKLSMHQCTSYCLDKLNLWSFYLWPSIMTLNYLPEQKVSNHTSSPQGEQLCQIIHA